jgi:hypothetical protein
MAASQVVIYFDKQEDALQFTLAASSIIADGAALRDTALKVAKEVCKASRITAEGSLNADGLKKNSKRGS